MQNFFKTKIGKGLMATVVAAIATTSLSASPFSSPTNNNNDSEKQNSGPFAFSFPYDVGLKNPRDYFFYADFLAMQADEDGLDYALTDTTATLSTFPTNSKVLGFSDNSHSWGWGYGFRLGLGIYLNHDMWTLSADWTHLFLQDSSRKIASTGESFIPLWIGPSAVLGTNANRAQARWKAYYNTLDVSFSKPYHVSRYFVAEPSLGFRGAWIDQDYQAKYDGVFTSTSPATSAANAQMTASNDYWGVGLRGGMKGEFLFGNGWALLGKGAYSILYGNFDIDQTDPSSGFGYTIDDNFHKTTSSLELGVGLAWGLFFNEDRNHFLVSVNYEFIQWYDQNQLRRFWDSGRTIPNDTVSRGDFSLNGVSIRARFDF